MDGPTPGNTPDPVQPADSGNPPATQPSTNQPRTAPAGRPSTGGGNLDLTQGARDILAAIEERGEAILRRLEEGDEQAKATLARFAEANGAPPAAPAAPQQPGGRPSGPGSDTAPQQTKRSLRDAFWGRNSK